MVNLDMMKQLLDRGIEPTLLNEVLRRSLVEAAPKVEQATVQATVQAQLSFTQPQWTSEAEVKQHMAKLKTAYASTQRARNAAGSMAGGGHVRGVYRLASEMPSIANMQSVVRNAMVKVGGRACLAEQLGIDIAPIVAWLTGARAPTTDEAEALSKCASLDSVNTVVICERARRVISTYRAELGMPIVRTRNRKGH